MATRREDVRLHAVEHADTSRLLVFHRRGFGSIRRATGGFAAPRRLLGKDHAAQARFWAVTGFGDWCGL